MKKIFTLLLLALTVTLSAQVQTFNLQPKFTVVAHGVVTDNLLVRDSAGLMKWISKAEFVASLPSGSQTLAQTLANGSVAPSSGMTLGQESSGYWQFELPATVGPVSYPAAMTIGKSSTSRYNIITPDSLRITNGSASREGVLSADKLKFGDGSHNLNLKANFTGVTAPESIVNFRLKGGTEEVAYMSDIAGGDTPSLQQVTNVGDTTTNLVNLDGGMSTNRSNVALTSGTEARFGTDIADFQSDFMFKNVLASDDTNYPNGYIQISGNIESGIQLNHSQNQTSTNASLSIANTSVDFNVSDGSDDNVYEIRPTSTNMNKKILMADNAPYNGEFTGGQLRLGQDGSNQKSDLFWDRLRFTDTSNRTATLSQSGTQTETAVNITLPNESGQLGVIKYKTYVATLEQNGTSDPVVTVLENQLGSVTWTRDSAGRYIGSFGDADLDGQRTIIFIGSVGDDVTDGSYSSRVYVDSTTEIFLETAQANDRADGMLKNTSIEIRVYP